MQMNKPSPRLAILRAQLAAKADDESFARALYSYSAQNQRTLRALPPLADSLPLPPSYSEDLEQWLAQRESERVHDAVLERQSAARSAAPANPSASVWISGQNVPANGRVGLWHVHAYCGASPARQAHTLRFDSGSSYRPAAPGTKEGDPYDESKYTTADMTARLAYTSSADGAALVGAKLTHSVCIKAHNDDGFVDYPVGCVIAVPRERLKWQPDCWLPCDKDGWIPHAAGDGCPVPVGVGCQLVLRARTVFFDVSEERDFRTYGYWDEAGEESITHWRPIAKDAS